jgi:hypothetical protein
MIIFIVLECYNGLLAMFKNREEVASVPLALCGFAAVFLNE